MQNSLFREHYAFLREWAVLITLETVYPFLEIFLVRANLCNQEKSGEPLTIAREFYMTKVRLWSIVDHSKENCSQTWHLTGTCRSDYWYGWYLCIYQICVGKFVQWFPYRVMAEMKTSRVEICQQMSHYENKGKEFSQW